MKIKLILGIGLLFVLIVTLNVLAIKHLNDLKHDTENILKANYRTLEYTKLMLSALEKKAHRNFEATLEKQEDNITEKGEQKTTAEIRKNFEALKFRENNTTLKENIRKKIYEIMDMNMRAIKKKSEIAKDTADMAIFWILITGLLGLIIALIILIKLPSAVISPIKKLTESIEQIASKDYAARVNFSEYSELVQLSEAFNTMAEKLEEYNNTNLAKLMIEQKSTETIINNMKNAVIGLDENLKITFVNSEAVRILGLDREELIGQMAQQLSEENSIVQDLTKDLIIGEVPEDKEKENMKIIVEGKESYFEKEILHIATKLTGEKNEKLIGHVIFLKNTTNYREAEIAKDNLGATTFEKFEKRMRTIKENLQALEKDQLEQLKPEQTELIRQAKKHAEELLELKNDLSK